jgi:hypothetical protein
MTAAEISDQLHRIQSDEHFAARTADLVSSWSASGTGAETIEPILRFIEEHPQLDLGAPGSLVHFVERFYGKGYETKLVESIWRKPTMQTVWMLNRILNGTEDPAVKRRLVGILEGAKQHPLAESNVQRRIDHFLERLQR